MKWEKKKGTQKLKHINIKIKCFLMLLCCYINKNKHTNFEKRKLSSPSFSFVKRRRKCGPCLGDLFNATNIQRTIEPFFRLIWWAFWWLKINCLCSLRNKIIWRTLLAWIDEQDNFKEETNIKVAIKSQSLASKVMIKLYNLQHIWLSPKKNCSLHILGREHNNNNNKKKVFLTLIL